MADEQSFETIPDYASEEARRGILEMAEESEPQTCAVECCEHLIRHWCETVEDGNPLYLDEEYAKSRGFRGLVAQPGMIVSTLTVPFRCRSKRSVYEANQVEVDCEKYQFF